MRISRTINAGKLLDTLIKLSAYSNRSVVLRVPSSIWFVATTIAVSSTLRADLPPPPPQDHEVRSANGQYIAKITVAPPQTTVYAVKDGGEEPIWSVAGFYRCVFLADDGEHMVMAPGDGDIPDDEFSPDVVVLRFTEHGRTVRDVALREVMPDLSKLWRSASNYSWAHHWEPFHINSRGEFVVKTVDYRTLYFAVGNAQLLKTKTEYVEWLGDVLRFPRGFRAVAASCILGALIGAVFGSRLLWAIMTTVALGTAILLFPVWAEARLYPLSFWEAFASNDFLVAKIGIFYLLLSTLSAIVVSLLWRRYRRS
jgi:hypothetical protein